MARSMGGSGGSRGGSIGRTCNCDDDFDRQTCI